MATTSVQLDEWCRDNNVKDFVGVFASDELAAYTPPPRACMIVNLDPIRGVLVHGTRRFGSHWVAIRLNGRRPAEYFDGMGRAPSSIFEGRALSVTPHIKKWLGRHAKQGFVRQQTQIESYNADSCGQFCCWFCKHGLPRLNPRAWGWLTYDTKLNDEKVKRLVVFK